ncbi:MAG: IS200/IS605 family transposase [Armatimonadota bacterium]
MPYWQLFYHLVWATKYRNPIISESIEEEIVTLIRNKAIGLGATVFALNGMPDHTHLVSTIPPSIAVATFVGKVKGASSAMFNKTGRYVDDFAWQVGYGAFSFDGSRLPLYVSYVERQKTHHEENTIIQLLERTDDQSSGLVKEPDPLYTIDETELWRELMELEKEPGI